MFSRLLYISIMQWRIVYCKRWSGSSSIIISNMQKTTKINKHEICNVDHLIAWKVYKTIKYIHVLFSKVTRAANYIAENLQNSHSKMYFYKIPTLRYIFCLFSNTPADLLRVPFKNSIHIALFICQESLYSVSQVSLSRMELQCCTVLARFPYREWSCDVVQC